MVVQYTNVITNLPTVKVSPDYPYVGKGAWVSVEIKEQVSGKLVPCGNATLTATAGSFGASGSTIVLDMAGGTAVT